MFEDDRARLLEGGRLLADGIPHSDLVRVRAQLVAGTSWHAAWMELSCDYENWAENRATSATSRGDWLWLGCMAAHVSQLYWLEDAEERRQSEHRRAALYRRAAPSLTPPARPMELAVTAGRGGRRVGTTAFLRLPAGRRGAVAPCVVLLGGLDSTKEESRLFEELCLDRGLATLTFDGPGQGETASSVRLGASFAPWVSAAIDLLGGCDGVGGDQVGLLGRSLGGTYALAAAPHEPRLRAVVAWSPLVSGESFDSMPGSVQHTFGYAAGLPVGPAAAVVREVVRSEQDAGAARVPTLLWQGRRDHIVGVEDQRRLEGAANEHVECVALEEGSHCGHNVAQFVRPLLADWLTDRLGAHGR